MLEIVWTYIAIFSGIYTIWPKFKVTSRDIVASRKKLVADLKAKALREKQAKKVAKRLDAIDANRRKVAKAKANLPRTKPNHLYPARGPAEEFMMV